MKIWWNIRYPEYYRIGQSIDNYGRWLGIRIRNKTWFWSTGREKR